MSTALTCCYEDPQHVCTLHLSANCRLFVLDPHSKSFVQTMSVHGSEAQCTSALGLVSCGAIHKPRNATGRGPRNARVPRRLPTDTSIDMVVDTQVRGKCSGCTPAMGLDAPSCTQA